MTPSQVLQDRLAALLAADDTTIDSDDDVIVHLYKAPFTPAPDLDVETLEEADFNTYAGKVRQTATNNAFRDPATGDWIVQVGEPVGGWHWQAGSSANLPQTIYGFAVTNEAGTEIYGSETLDEPVELTQTGDGLDLPFVRFRIPAGVIQ